MSNASSSDNNSSILPPPPTASSSGATVPNTNNHQNLKPVTSIHQVLYQQQQSPTHGQEFHRVNPQEFDMIKVSLDFRPQWAKNNFNFYRLIRLYSHPLRCPCSRPSNHHYPRRLKIMDIAQTPMATTDKSWRRTWKNLFLNGAWKLLAN